MSSLKGENIISIRDLSREILGLVFKKAEEVEERMKNGAIFSNLRGKVMASLFFEPSTRTQLSFSSAMKKLGGEVIGFSDPEGSSTKKGENLADTVRTVERYSNVVVIRHPKKGSARWAADNVEIPVINAGDGANQHPTQTLLDLYTIFKHFTEEIRIGFVGDLKYGRTVHSLITALALYYPEKIKEVRLISPSILKLGEEYCELLERKKVGYIGIGSQTTEELNLKGLDVVYMTRIQKERFPDLEEYEKVKGIYKLSPEIVGELDEGTKIMHPLPRIDEISPEVDAMDQAIFFDQVGNGLPVRMSLLSLILGED